MAPDDRPLRADAERNRLRLLAAAEELFRERGLEVGVGEIAEHAGVGRGTLFRNFASKEDLIAAVVVERVASAMALGRAALEADDPVPALFEFLEEIVGRQQLDRALFEAVGDTFMTNPEIRGAHLELMGILDQLLTRAQATGQIRADVGALDILMLIKGVCQAATAFAHIDPGVAERQLDLIRAALAQTGGEQALRGRTPSLDDMERAFGEPAANAAAASERRGRAATG